ncbi:hypothetical protein O9993_11345 [Vibrio lentus]|nr:hypothetical protein [Vibrio lentus]
MEARIEFNAVGKEAKVSPSHLTHSLTLHLSASQLHHQATVFHT